MGRRTFRPKKRKNPMMPDGWRKHPRGKTAQMASEIPSGYRCPKCGHHVQVKIAVVVMSNSVGSFTIEPRITCDNCKVEYVEFLRDK